MLNRLKEKVEDMLNIWGISTGKWKHFKEHTKKATN
jgi:hypothetical protein